MTAVKGFFKGVGCMCLHILIMSVFATIFPHYAYLPKLLSGAVSIVVFMLLYYMFEKKHSNESFLRPVNSYSVKSVGISLLVWVICCYMLITIALFIAYIYTDPTMEARTEYFQQQVAVSPGLSMLTSCILSPIVEELAYRLCAYNVMKQSMIWPVAMFFSGLFFGIMHGTLAHCVFGTLFGCVLVLIYELNGRNIVVPIACHSIYNFVVMHSGQDAYPFTNTIVTVCYVVLIAIGVTVVSIKVNKMMKYRLTSPSKNA